MLVLLGLFLAVPLIEVALFIVIGSQIGVWDTIILCIVSAAVGALVVRHQGLRALTRLQQRLRTGVMPADELAEGAAIFAAGILLIAPGFFSDTVGFILLIPPARRWIIAWLGQRFAGNVRTFGARGSYSDLHKDRERGPTIIDVEAEEVQDGSEPRGKPNSPWRRDE